MPPPFEDPRIKVYIPSILATLRLHRYRRTTAATALAKATGIKLRGFHSKSNNSTASKTAATGEANVADIPPAAPATSSVLRSALVR